MPGTSRAWGCKARVYPLAASIATEEGVKEEEARNITESKLLVVYRLDENIFNNHS